MKKRARTAAEKAALAISISEKIFSDEVRIAKISIEDYCIEKKMSNGLATCASLRLALAHFVFMLTNLGFNAIDKKAIIKRTLLLTLDSMDFEEK